MPCRGPPLTPDPFSPAHEEEEKIRKKSRRLRKNTWEYCCCELKI
jgi:hypothetical protein